MRAIIHNLYKPPGFTPLEIVEIFRNNYQLTTSKLTYIGRLDPMASGVQLVLENPNPEAIAKYKGLDKEYVVEMAFGISTDSYDTLGLVDSIQTKNLPNEDLIFEKLMSFQGAFQQAYPPYSAARIGGKALFEYAKAGLIDTITIPKKTVQVYQISEFSSKHITTEQFIKTTLDRISLVKGNFRQKEIVEAWQSQASSLGSELLTLKCKIHCSSGTYIRSICHHLGQELGCGAVCFDLLRTSVGAYQLSESIRL